ncbi:MAG: hypothetical protein JSS81_25410 [Acidobacteria bacterium]|nr:hypothetical protein [Acidobacteriota bacterium]
MKKPLILLLFCVFLSSNLHAQKTAVKNKPKFRPPAVQKNEAIAVVIDERLAVLRAEPSLYARPVQRMRRGRLVRVFEAREADGVTFYRVAALPNTPGWVQKEAVAARLRRGDDERLARLIQVSDGFERIERARIFLETYPDSPLRPSILLFYGDLAEEIAARLSVEAAKRLSRREMTVSGAPVYSFFLNYSSLDRFRRLGIVFRFNAETRLFHYDGASWQELVGRYPNTNEAREAQKRLDSLQEKMQAVNEPPNR